MAKNNINIEELAAAISRNLAEFQKGQQTAEKAASLEKSIEAQKEALAQFNDELERSNASYTENLELQAKSIKANIDQVKSEIELRKIRNESYDDLNEKLDELIPKLAEVRNQLKDTAGSFKAGAQAGEMFANALGITDNKLDSFIGNLSEGKGSLKAFGDGLKKNFSVTKIATAVVGKMAKESYDLLLVTNKINSQFRKDYGVQYGNRLAKSTMAVEQSLRRFNVGYEDTAKAVESLNVSVSDFGDMSEENRQALITDSALLQKLGVDNEEYAQSIQSMTKAFGDSVEGAQENMREMRLFSNAIGRSTKQVVKDFTAVKSYLAQFGASYEKIFRRMETIAKKTGAAISDLQGIALGFDQFEGAADSVGKLNALLGGPFLNTIDMLNTEDPAEIIMKIKDAFDASGKSVNSMTRRELQAFAATIPGINGDVEKLRTIFGQLDSGMLSTADSINAVLEGTTDTTKSLEEQADASMSLEDRQAAISKQMAASAEQMERAANIMSEALSKINQQGSNAKNLATDASKLGLKAKSAMNIGSSVGKEASSAAAKEAGEAAAKEVGEVVAKEALEQGAKAVAKEGAKAGAKAASKRVPVAGALVAGAAAGMRYDEGDYFGATLELLSGAASIGEAAAFTGLGAPVGAVALGIGGGIDAYLAGRDISRAMSAEPGEFQSGPAMATGGIVTKPVTNATIGEAGKEAVIPLESGTNHLVEPLALALKQVMAPAGAGAPNINLTVVLEGREMRAFVKQVIADTLNPFK